MPRYKLRTLLILVALLPPLLWIGWGRYQAWKAEREMQQRARVRHQWLDQFGVLPPVTELRKSR